MERTREEWVNSSTERHNPGRKVWKRRSLPSPGESVAGSGDIPQSNHQEHASVAVLDRPFDKGDDAAEVHGGQGDTRVAQGERAFVPLWSIGGLMFATGAIVLGVLLIAYGAISWGQGLVILGAASVLGVSCGGFLLSMYRTERGANHARSDRLDGV